MSKTNAKAPLKKSSFRDTVGAYQVEYTIVLVLVAIVGSVAIAGLTVPLIRYYRSVQLLTLIPVP